MNKVVIAGLRCMQYTIPPLMKSSERLMALMARSLFNRGVNIDKKTFITQMPFQIEAFAISAIELDSNTFPYLVNFLDTAPDKDLKVPQQDIQLYKANGAGAQAQVDSKKCEVDLQITKVIPVNEESLFPDY